MPLFQSLGVAKPQAGKGFASGTLTPADEDVEVVTGLSTVDHCGVSLAGVPANGHLYSRAVPGATAGNVRIYSYENDFTVSTTEVAVTWWAVGNL